ncbi:MAG: penicillin-binding transpeptidase domain-containing protein [Chitinophagales bacterium]
MVKVTMLGYLSEVNDNDIESSNGYYEMGDYKGKTGLESFYDDRLRGEKGFNFVMVDVKNSYKGKYKDGKDDKKAEAGWDLVTGIDAELQAYGEKLMEGKVGSVVAIEPSTGEILAYISSPGFDPNLLTGRYRQHNFNILFRDEYKPLLNRPIYAQYPPGSTFKAAAALVMLQDGTHPWDWNWFCPGGYRVGNHVVKCHGSHAIPDVQTALQHSCNSYFCKVYNDLIMDSIYASPQVGYQKWWDYMYQFGYGHKLGIDLYGEKSGNLPTVQYYDKIFGKSKWRAASIISNAIGQGEILATPLQIANAMATIANEGYYYTPTVARYLVKDKKAVKPKKEKVSVGINKAYFKYIIDGLEKVVKQGTARIAQIPDIIFCGKTGTAENPHGKDHSVFAGFAPKDNPKIAIAVFVENAGFGATYAAPIASLMVEKYLNDTIAKKRIPLEKKMFNADLIDRKVYYDTIGDPLRAKQVRDSISNKKRIQDSILLQKKKVQDSINNSKNNN